MNQPKYMVRSFILRSISDPILLMPKGAKILKIGRKKQSPIIWALCREGAPLTKRLIRVYNTNEILPDEPGQFLNTIDDLGYEWHLFDGGERAE